MIRKESLSFTAQSAGRVDKVSSEIPRSVFSYPSCTIYVNDRVVKKSFRVSAGDIVTVTWSEEVFEGLEGEDIPLDILYEDDSILVINKPCGMVVHPGAGNWSGTLVNALLYRYGEDFATSEDEEVNLMRPGIVHRLDKDTSGVMVIAKTADAHRNLAGQFASHTTEKTYIAIAKGYFEKKRGTVDRNIVRNPSDRKSFITCDDVRKGKSAVTHYTVLRQSQHYAFLRIRIETGRTHQIRVHMKSINHPLLGDDIYSNRDRNFPSVRLCLHALSLSFAHPVSGERMTFYAPMPERIRTVLKQILA